MIPNDRDVNLLECTLRDGSYAVNFKFTGHDTGYLTGILSALGFRLIEIGHGQGLGAGRAGKGAMPHDDIELIRSAKAHCGKALVGMFAIPGLASLDLLTEAAEAGLDFVRIGQDAPTAEEAFSFVEYARSLGLMTCMNFMKSYAVSADVFGEKCALAAEAGAQVVYLVDSVGGMTPESTKAYLNAVRERSSVAMGFHSHDNLKLAHANCLAAYAAGARYIDTTLSGLGRGAGNAASEVMAALFEMYGVRTGLDFLRLLDVTEEVMTPLVASIQMHSMLGVAMGYGQFHSSFLPRVLRVAREYGVDPKRLVIIAGRHNPLAVDEKFLEQEARALGQHGKGGVSERLIAFDQPEFAKGKMNVGRQSLETLVEGLEVVGAKRNGVPVVLEIVASIDPDEELFLAEFVAVSAEAALGRLTVGSLSPLIDALSKLGERVSLFLVDKGRGAWARGLERLVGEAVGRERTAALDGAATRFAYALEWLRFLRSQISGEGMFVYGLNEVVCRHASDAAPGEETYVYLPRAGDAEVPEGTLRIQGLNELKGFEVRVGLLLLVEAPQEDELRQLLRYLGDDVVVASMVESLPLPIREQLVNRLLVFDSREAYVGLVNRVVAARTRLAELRRQS